MKKTFPNEWELLQGINEGHRDAIEAFHNIVMPIAFLIAYNIVKDKFEAERLAWEAFLATIHPLKKFKSFSHAKKYVYATARNKSLNFIDSDAYKNRSANHSALPDVQADTDIESAIFKAEYLKEMQELVKKLPPDDQLILQLFANDKSTMEIATEINKDNQYVLNRKNTLFKRLRELLKRKGLLCFSLV